MSLRINGRQEVLGEAKIQPIFKKALKKLSSGDKEINIVFVSEKLIKKINKKYRDKDMVTDVLSFSYEEEDLFGEILICTKRVREQASLYKITPKEEMIKILVHGLVHLFGYDHIREEDHKKMEKKEREILAQIY